MTHNPPPTILRRIDGRGRAYERDMDPDYIAALNTAYNFYFHHYDECISTNNTIIIQWG